MNLTSKNLVLLLFWLIPGILSFCLLDLQPQEPYKIAIIYLGILIIIHGLVYFNLHGGNLITPSTVFLLFSTLLIGFPAIYINFDPTFHISDGHYLGAVIGYISQLLIYFLFSNQDYELKNNMQLIGTKRLKKWSLYFSLCIVIIGYLFGRMSYYFDFFESGSIYIGVIMLTISLVLLSEEVGIKQITISVLLFLLYYLLKFENFGRINLVTLLLSVIIILNIRFNIKGIKLILSIMFYPAITIGAYLRSGDLFNLSAGVGSIISPFYRFGQLIELYQNGLFSLRFGETIYAAFVVLVPRAIWESKPWNFNREITFIFTPQYVSAGHSEAAVLYAEMFFNFGYIGFLLTIIFLGVLIRRLDKFYFNIISKDKWLNKDIILFILLIVFSTGMLNLLWGGFSTFINRDGFRIIVLLFFIICYKSLPKKSRYKVEK